MIYLLLGILISVLVLPVAANADDPLDFREQ